MPTDETIPLIEELLAAQRQGHSVVLATIIRARGSVPRHAGSKMLVYEDGHISGTVGGGEMESRVIAEARAALHDANPRLVPYSLVDPTRGDPGVCGGEMEIYLEPYLPPATVFVIGAGHVGQAVADLAHWLGYRVTVHDDRTELVNEETIPHADAYLSGDIDQALARQPITRNTFIILTTRNVMVDRQILPQLVDTPAPYIGVIGSRKRWQHTKKLLLEDGLTEEQLSQFHSPLGLELNAETPEEIAVSIMAEIIMLSRGGSGERMSD